MKKISAMYHERMFYFWYGKSAKMRDYHGKRYHRIMSIPTVSANCGISFRSCKHDFSMAVQGIAVVAGFVFVMLGLVAQFA